MQLKDWNRCACDIIHRMRASLIYFCSASRINIHNWCVLQSDNKWWGRRGANNNALIIDFSLMSWNIINNCTRTVRLQYTINVKSYSFTVHRIHLISSSEDIDISCLRTCFGVLRIIIIWILFNNNPISISKPNLHRSSVQTYQVFVQIIIYSSGHKTS